MTALRLEGFAASLPQRKSMLEVRLRSFGEVSTIGAVASRQLWQAVRGRIHERVLRPANVAVSVAPSEKKAKE